MNQIIVQIGRFYDQFFYQQEKKLKRISYQERGDGKAQEGEIYLAHVLKVNRQMGYAFVRLNDQENGFLHDKQKVASLCPQDPLVVQVQKEKTAGKEAKVTARISLGGHFVVFLPQEAQIHLSKRLENIQANFLQALSKNLPEGAGLIVRSNLPQKLEEVQEELSGLIEKWRQIKKEAAQKNKPGRLGSKEDPALSFIRACHPSSPWRLMSNDKERAKAVVGDLPKEQQPLSVDFLDSEDLAERAGLSGQIKTLYQKKVVVSPQCWLSIERTEAFHTIDVNGISWNQAGFDKNAFALNRQAAQAAVEQILLRNLGGIILIDFIDMQDEQLRQQLRGEVQNLLQQDYTQSSVMEISRLSILEVVRKHSKEEISSWQMQICPLCQGHGRVSGELRLKEWIVSQAKKAAWHRPGQPLSLAVPVMPSMVLQEVAKQASEEFGIVISLDFLNF